MNSINHEGVNFHFCTGERKPARQLVLDYHYSGRCHNNPVMVGSLHLDGGLFGDKGEIVAACIFGLSNNNTWAVKKVNVIELVRLVRKEGIKAPLSWLISKTIKALKHKGGYDIAISYADATQEHHGGIYQACSWNYHTYREPGEDGLIIDGEFVPRRSVSTRFGTYSKGKLSEMFDEVILSTDSELIAYTCQMEGVRILQRPETLSGDDVASVPVFRHIVENFPCDIHLNYNCNFPVCDSAVFTKAIELARESGESLSVPYAVWAQTVDCLKNYDDPMKITASRFETELVHSVDIHTMDDLLAVHRDTQKRHAWENIKKMVKF